MGKRVTVRYKGGSHYTAMRLIPAGTMFKAVESTDGKGYAQGVFIRGSSLTKAAKGKHKFKAKQYLFILGDVETKNQMEIVHEV